MELYQHDSPESFRFVIRGALNGAGVTELEHAWSTVRSVLGTKTLIVDVSGVSGTDRAGVELLSCMRDAGACLTGALPLESESRVRSFRAPEAARSGGRKPAWRRKIRKLVGLLG